MKLAVILPVYNAEPYLAACLDSLFNQTVSDFCVLAINDASTDGSGKMLEQYAAREPRLRVYHFSQNQGGPAATQFAFNLLTHMQVSYVARMDSDDICQPTRFEKQMAFLDDNPHIDVVGSNMRLFGEAQPDEETNVPLTDAEIKVNFLRARANILNPTSMYRQATIAPLQVKYNVLPTSCDYAMWVELALQGKRFANLAEPLVHYRMHAAQASNKVELITRCAVASLTRYMQGMFPELNPTEAATLARVCYGTVELTIPECQLVLQAETKIQHRTQSQLGENREQALAFIASRANLVRQAIAD